MFFNISTFSATQADLTTAQARHLIWAPDVLGSICFLVASWFAYAEVNRGVLPRSDRSIGWRIAALNMLGSDRVRGRPRSPRATCGPRASWPTSRW